MLCGQVLCGRACVVYDGTQCRVFGGLMCERADGMERHSYETELQAFIDGMHSVPAGSALAVITDCLSGAMAAAVFGRRPLHAQAGRYRADMLQHVSELLDAHRSTAMLWCHSHVGITANEVADAEVDRLMREEVELEEPGFEASYQTLRIPGLKRSLGELVLANAQARLDAWLMGSVERSLVPHASTWKAFGNGSLMRRYFSAGEAELVAAARCDRLGLLCDATERPAGQRSLGHYLRADHDGGAGELHARGVARRCCCGALVRQDRWHTCVACPGPEGSARRAAGGAGAGARRRQACTQARPGQRQRRAGGNGA